MAWFGKIALGSLGMMFGGPLGAVLGAALGHQLIDKQQTARRQLFQQSGTLLDNVAPEPGSVLCVHAVNAG